MSCPFPRTSFSLMLRSVVLLCNSRPSWAFRADNGLLWHTPYYMDDFWYGTKEFDEVYASYIPRTEGGETKCFCKKVLSLLRLFWKIVDPVVSAPNHFSAAAAILPEQECFPVDTNSSEVVTVNGTYSEERAFDPNQDYPNGGWFQLGSITWPKDADPNKLEKVSPTSVSSRHFDQNTGSSGLPLHWEVADEQWEEKCLGWHWVNNKTNTYDRQIKIRECISKKYTRKCPSGQALFKKVIPPVAGTCLTDRSQTELGKLHLKASGACPDNLVATKDNSRCQCETTC